MNPLTRTLAGMTTAAALALGSTGATAAPPFPEVISLPDGWQAEGIAAGPGTTVYAGSLATGAVWQAALRTREGGVLVPAKDGRVAVGLKESRGLLYVAGGPTGQAYVYDARTGEEVAAYDLGATDGSSFVNDVTITPDAAWFTDSAQAVLYRVPLQGGKPAGPAVPVPLGGDWAQVEGFNANGIASTPSGSALLVINSTLGVVYRVDPATGIATEVETDADLTAGDGILLQGRTLSVVRNRLEEIAVLRLSPDLTSATLTDTLTDPDFAVPTTIAAFGPSLYAVNARFGTPDPAQASYEIVKVDGS